jgi:ankyrin repeat protein
MADIKAHQIQGVLAFMKEVERKDGAGEVWALAHDAAYRGDVLAVEKFLVDTDEMTGEVQYEVDAPHPIDGRTLLHSAVKGIPSPLYEYLVNDCSANVDARDNKGRTPLLYAAANGSPRAITRLLALGADEKAVDNEGCGAVLIAAQAGQIRTVLWLFQGGIPLLPAADGRTGRCADLRRMPSYLEFARPPSCASAALHMAAFAGHTSNVSADCMLARLVAIGIDLESTTHNGFTAMHFAALGDKPQCIQKLLDLGK